MKIIIAGSRKIKDYTSVDRAMIASGFSPTEIVSGNAGGVDQLGEDWADAHNIPVRRFPANWRVFGPSAGFIRNEEMASYADALVYVWDGQSRGTKHMIKVAKQKGLKRFGVIKYDTYEQYCS